MGYAIYTGDINQDGSVDGQDYLIQDAAIQNGDGGYILEDTNGDGAADGQDYIWLSSNIQNAIGAVIP